MQPSRVQFSVVIASAGQNAALIRVVNQFSSWKSRPNEIIVCLPPIEVDQLLEEALLQAKVKIVHSLRTGQVMQRIVGVLAVKDEWFLYIDDDMIVDSFDELLALPVQKNCVYGFFGASEDGSLVRTRKFLQAGFLSNLLTGILGYRGLEDGSVILNGLGVPFSYFQRENCIGKVPVCLEMQWISGGAFFCQASQFPDNDYYPFEGYAFAEDIILSKWWRCHNVKIFHVPIVRAVEIGSNKKRGAAWNLLNVFRIVKICLFLKKAGFSG